MRGAAALFAAVFRRAAAADSTLPTASVAASRRHFAVRFDADQDEVNDTIEQHLVSPPLQCSDT